jgi:predicted CopG family antitoxin
MEDTTIALKKDVKEKIKEFGYKGETYSDIIMRLLKSARERQLYDLLMDEKDTVSIEVALENAKKQWQR